MAKQAPKITETKDLVRQGGKTPTVRANLPAVAKTKEDRLLTREQFQGLAQLPPEAEWFVNIQNPRTKRAYEMT